MTGGRKIDLKAEIEALKARARGVFGTTPPPGRTPEPPRPRAAEPKPEPPEPRPPRPSGPLELLVPGVTTRTEAGELWRVAGPASLVRPESPRIHGEYIEALAGEAPASGSPAAPLEILQKAGAGGILYLDIETTGLSNSPLFLVGLMYSAPEGLVIDQLFARDYTEEAAVLAATAQAIARYPLLVTFNGARFDIPFISERLLVHGLPAPPGPVHVDLLPVSRAICAGRTPNHRLQTLERYVLGRKRVGDIPGAEIPGAYHEFVRTGNAGEMAAVIHHNRLDLLSMLELVTVYLTRV